MPSVGFRFVLAEPARLVTDNGDVERLLVDAAPVVTTLFAGPVAPAGTLTTAPTCVMTVFDDPLTVMVVPFGAVTVVPAGTYTDVFAVMVKLEPATGLAGEFAEVGELALPDPPPPQALKNMPHHTTKTARRKIRIGCSLLV